MSVWYREDYRRVVLATFFHADDWHLYYNMVSFLWKGRQLEPRLGSVYFGFLLALFSVLTNGLMLLINSGMEIYLHKPEYLTHCAVGFSGEQLFVDLRFSGTVLAELQVQLVLFCVQMLQFPKYMDLMIRATVCQQFASCFSGFNLK